MNIVSQNTLESVKMDAKVRSILVAGLRLVGISYYVQKTSSLGRSIFKACINSNFCK